jgi:CheY-like chemotaxis protein
LDDYIACSCVELPLNSGLIKTMNKIALIEKELIFLGLLDKAREIYAAFSGNSALAYIKSSYHLLSKVYHPDLNPGNENKAKSLQQRLNHVSDLISQASDEELIGLLKGGLQEEANRKKKILVVEDEFGLQETLRDIFRMEGYDVRVAVDGVNGYHAFLEFKPDLVFTDIVMPKMGGLELVKKIRQDHPQIKVIYISGFFGLKNVKRDLDEDILKYGYPCLSKPFKISAMLELVDDYLNNRIGSC